MSAYLTLRITQRFSFVGAILFAAWILTNPFPAKPGLPVWASLIGPGIGMTALALNGLAIRRKLKKGVL